MALDNRSVRKAAGLLLGLVLLFVYSQYIAPRVEERGDDGGRRSGEMAGDPNAMPSSDTGRSGAGSDSATPGKQLSAADQKLLGQLKQRANGEMVSYAGLRYTKGSLEGHRLDHLRRHDNDIPNRDGPHGVFDGDERRMLAIVDEAYWLVKQNDPAAMIRRDGNRTICTVDFKRRIGFVGGSVGNRKGRPPAQHVRLVLEGDRLITAYPVQQ